MCSVRHSPMPSAPRSRALLASSPVSALVRTASLPLRTASAHFRIVVNSADLNPFELAYDVASLMRPRAIASDLDLTIRVDGSIPEVLESDLVRVRQILVNLIGNAIKFTETGSIEIVLRLDENESSDHRYLCFDVIDTGVGIESDKLEAIFSPFSQADS